MHVLRIVLATVVALLVTTTAALASVYNEPAAPVLVSSSQMQDAKLTHKLYVTAFAGDGDALAPRPSSPIPPPGLEQLLVAMLPPEPPPVVKVPPAAPSEPTAGIVRAAARPVAPEPGTVEALIAQYDWDYGTALRIATCESGLRSVQNIDGGPYFGIFQLWIGHFRAGEDWADPATNVAVAYRVYLGSGWSPWECR